MARTPKTAPTPAAAAETERAAEQLADLHVLAPAEVETAPTPAAPSLKIPKPLPASVTLLAPYAYFDDEGQFHSWPDSHVVEIAEEIHDLYSRGAPIMVTPDEPVE